MKKYSFILTILFIFAILPRLLFSQNEGIRRLGEWGTGPYSDVFVQGNYAYCAAGVCGLDILDISDPSNPLKIGNCELPVSAGLVRVAGSNAYVIGSSKLISVNVSDPSFPSIVGSYDLAAGFQDYFVNGNYVYIALGNNGLQIVDVSNPSSPSLLGTYNAVDEVKAVRVRESYAYIILGDFFQILDISNPITPEPVATISTDGFSEIYVSGDAVYGLTENGVQIVNISDPSLPTIVGNYEVDKSRWGFTLNNVEGLYVNRGYLYTVVYFSIYSGHGIYSHYKDLYIINIENITNPFFETDINLWSSLLDSKKMGPYRKIYGNGDYLFVSKQYEGLDILDVSSPVSPSWMSIIQIQNVGIGLFVNKKYLYVSGVTGSYIVGLSNPSKLNLISVLGGDIPETHIYIKEDFAYLARYRQFTDWPSLYNNCELTISDISNPLDPVTISSPNIGKFTVNGIYVSDNFAYISSGTAGLNIIDIVDPTSPSFRGNYDTTNSVNNACVVGDYAYLADGESGLQIVNISDPSSPTLVSSFDTPGQAYDVHISGNYAYLADGESGLQVVDITDPLLPSLAGSFDTSGDAKSIYVANYNAYVADGQDGLKIIDITNPSLPTLAHSYQSFCSSAEKVFFSGNYIYVLAGKLYILFAGDDLPPLISVKNPSNKSTVRGNVTIQSTASDDNGIVRVEFYIDGNKVGDDSSLPFEHIWNTELGSDGEHILKVVAYDTSNQTEEDEITIKVNNTNPAEIELNRTDINFGATIDGSKTESQRVLIRNKGGDSLSWTITSKENWLEIQPPSGVGDGFFEISVNPEGLQAGTYIDTLNVEDINAINSPQLVNVSLQVWDENGDSYPFGYFDTPIDGTVGVSGAIPVTGWVLDDVGVESLKIYRDPVEGENTKDLVYIGDALFVEGARPDVEQAYPDYPLNYQAGWGYMMLTNFLPGQGNGTIKIHAYAKDKDGHSVSLGTKTITCDNANAVKPFGAIDTPSQGGEVGGTFINYGWALTPQPNYIPLDSSTIDVWVDGVNLGHPAYNQYRDDIATLFPGYANSNGAVGAYLLDTTAYTNGVHTIAWSVADNLENTDGIGSRFFNIVNTSGSSSTLGTPEQALHLTSSETFESIGRMFVNFETLKVRRGFQEDIEPERVEPDAYGVTEILIREVERVEIFLGEGSGYRGYMVVGEELRALPIGSSLDSEKGIFYWQPGPGFIGDYDLVFIKEDEFGMQKKIAVKVKIMPKFGRNPINFFKDAKAKGEVSDSVPS